MIELALNSNLTLQYAEARPAGMRIASALAADLASFALEVRPFCVPLAVASHSPLSCSSSLSSWSLRTLLNATPWGLAN